MSATIARRDVLAGLACGIASAACGAGAARTTAGPPPTATQHPLFTFRSGLWINLHHDLCGLGSSRPEASAQAPDPQTAALFASRTAFLERAAPDAKERWDAAIRYYADAVVPRDLLFDDELVALDAHLGALGDQEDVRGVPGEKAIVEHLTSVAPSYRALAFGERDARNRKSVAPVAAWAHANGARVAADLVDAYRAPWPARIEVDVVGFASARYPAYTTFPPVQIRFAPTHPRMVGAYATELLFHEASHALVAPAKTAIERAFSERGAPPPDDLWHALLFFTTGEIVRRYVAGHVPYAEHFGLYERVPEWKAYRDVLVARFSPYLARKDTFEGAIGKLAEDLRRRA